MGRERGQNTLFPPEIEGKMPENHEYTRRYPAKSGYYWLRYRENSSGDFIEDVVEVGPHGDVSAPSPQIPTHINDLTPPKDVWWAGPLTPPAAPKPSPQERLREIEGRYNSEDFNWLIARVKQLEQALLFTRIDHTGSGLYCWTTEHIHRHNDTITKVLNTNPSED